MEENKNREERTEQETKQTKEDVIIKKLDAIQIQNGIIMSTIGEIVFVLLSKRKEINLNPIYTAGLKNCNTSIAGALTKIEIDTGMCTEEEMKKQDETVDDILCMILDLLK